MEDIEKSEKYFVDLSKIANRLSNLRYGGKKRVLSEYDYMVGESPFSQIEINRILNSSKK